MVLFSHIHIHTPVERKYGIGQQNWCYEFFKKAIVVLKSSNLKNDDFKMKWAVIRWYMGIFFGHKYIFHTFLELLSLRVHLYDQNTFFFFF